MLSLTLPLPLPLAEPPVSADPVHSETRTATLWAAIHLPALPLEALGVAADATEPVIVVDGELQRATIIALTTGARAKGVVIGMTAGAACARSADLGVRVRDRVREAAALDRLAAWSERFTSVVSPEPPADLLLEIGGSLQLFGGVQTLRERLGAELEATGHAAQLALAPTPRAALWLARAHRNLSSDPLSGTLGALPTTALRLPERAAHDLERLGVHTLREVFRLPRDGLTRRFGPSLLRDWDRALGRIPEPRRHWQGEQRFVAERELPASLHDFTRMEPFINDLVMELASALHRCDAGIDTLALAFEHSGLPATLVVLQLLTVSRDFAHLAGLLHTRMEHVRLPASTMTLRLESGVFKAIATHTAALIKTSTAPAVEVRALLETLRARLGQEAVYSLAPVADHRPEHAWRLTEPEPDKPKADRPNKKKSAAPCLSHPFLSSSRPFWLLSTPEPLNERNGSPCYQNHRLRLTSETERIESGWWSEQDIHRDYRLARTDDGSRLWIFRDHDEQRWFLHGYFA